MKTGRKGQPLQKGSRELNILNQQDVKSEEQDRRLLCHTIMERKRWVRKKRR
tara:strand:+ start:180 stop:335 length:156 start_codon:yes stop_codon:yes gene_type:complete